MSNNIDYEKVSGATADLLEKLEESSMALIKHDQEVRLVKNKLSVVRGERLSDIVKEHSPFEIGTIRKATVHPHRGRDMVVDKVSYNEQLACFVARGRILRKDGSKGARWGKKIIFAPWAKF